MLDRNRKANRWEDSASLARFVPSELAVPWLPVADEVSFALGRLHRTDAAVELRAAAYAIEPCHRRASARQRKCARPSDTHGGSGHEGSAVGKISHGS